MVQLVDVAHTAVHQEEAESNHFEQHVLLLREEIEPILEEHAAQVDTLSQHLFVAGNLWTC